MNLKGQLEFILIIGIHLGKMNSYGYRTFTGISKTSYKTKGN